MQYSSGLNERERVSWSCVLLLSVVPSMLTATWAHPDYTGLEGQPYCAQNQRKGVCCLGRQDDCSVPILGTLCYCDDFCSNRTLEEDCCPDFWSFCRGQEDPNKPGAAVDPLCLYKGKTYYRGQKFQENCNTCKCTRVSNDERQVFCETNVCLMDQEIIDAVNILEKSDWVARNYSFFWARTLDEGLSLKLGTKNPKQSVYRMNPVRRIYNPDELPKEFDSRIKWSGNITPIQDQYWCGASWAISTVDVASDRFAIMSKGVERVHLSAQHLVSCNNRGQQACDGGYLDRAWLFMRKFGLTDAECTPWIGKGDKCRIPRRSKLSEAGCKKRNSYSLRNELYKVGPAYRLGNETDIMHEILTSGPVQATMKVYHDFFNYESGIYSHSRISERAATGYHSVRIVGWGEEPSALSGRTVKFWRVANSWGREWGEDGYFRIRRGTNECEIESFVLGVWAKTV